MCFCYKCIIGIYHFRSAPKIIQTLKFLTFQSFIARFFSLCKPKTCSLGSCSSLFSGKIIQLNRNIHVHPKTGSLLCIDCEILNMEFFFHKQYGILIPKRLPTWNSCCFKINKATEIKPKRMNCFIFSAPEYFCWLYYFPYTHSQ